MAKKKYSRLEINRMVRRFLVQNTIDLTQLNFSSSIRSIRLYGRMVKTTGRELKIKEVENLIRSLETIPGISDLQFDLENWKISSGSITPKGHKREKKLNKSATADIAEQNLAHDPSKWDEEEQHEERKEKGIVKKG